MYLLPKGTGIVYEAEIIHFEHKREPSFLTTTAVFQPLFSEQNFSSHFRSVKNILPENDLLFGQMMNASFCASLFGVFCKIRDVCSKWCGAKNFLAAGRGLNLRGGAKSVSNQLIQKFDKSTFLLFLRDMQRLMVF